MPHLPLPLLGWRVFLRVMGRIARHEKPSPLVVFNLSIGFSTRHTSYCSLLEANTSCEVVFLLISLMISRGCDGPTSMISTANFASSFFPHLSSLASCNKASLPFSLMLAAIATAFVGFGRMFGLDKVRCDTWSKRGVYFLKQTSTGSTLPTIWVTCSSPLPSVAMCKLMRSYDFDSFGTSCRSLPKLGWTANEPSGFSNTNSSYSFDNFIDYDSLYCVATIANVATLCSSRSQNLLVSFNNQWLCKFVAWCSVVVVHDVLFLMH